jgi:hypothetical protein
MRCGADVLAMLPAAELLCSARGITQRARQQMHATLFTAHIGASRLRRVHFCKQENTQA